MHLLQCRLLGDQAGAGVGGNADHRKGLACGGALDGVLLNQSCLVPTYESYVCALSSGRKCRRVFICVGCADRVSAASQLTNPGGFKQPPKSQVRTVWSQGRPQILCSPLCGEAAIARKEERYPFGRRLGSQFRDSSTIKKKTKNRDSKDLVCILRSRKVGS